MYTYIFIYNLLIFRAGQVLADTSLQYKKSKSAGRRSVVWAGARRKKWERGLGAVQGLSVRKS